MRMSWAGWLRSAAALFGLGCPAEAPDLGPQATACGRVVAYYLGVRAAVEVVDAETDDATRKVRIDYRSMDDANTPLEGVALCRFQDNGRGLGLTGAFVDENRLRDDEIAGFNTSASGG